MDSLPPFPADAQKTVLESGVPYDTSLPAWSYSNFILHVPTSAARLTISITGGSGDLDLFVKYAEPFQLDIYDDPWEDADFVSDGEGWDESIEISSDTLPPLQSGVWYVATFNWNDSATSFTLSATIESDDLQPTEPQMPLPAGQAVYDTYDPVITPATSLNPSEAMPIGLGSVATGGDNFTISVKFPQLSGPADIYLVFHSPSISPYEIFLFAEDGSILPMSLAGLIPWRRTYQGPFEGHPLGTQPIPLSVLPAGHYTLYAAVTPAGSLECYYLWQTYFVARSGSGQVPEGSAGFFDGTVVAPNATIISSGLEYTGSAPVSPGWFGRNHKRG